MRHSCWLILLAVGLTGCEWLKNLGPTPDANPVMGDPPPRMEISAQSNHVGSTGRSRLESDSKILRVSTGNGDSRKDLTGAEVVATVDGSPILASEILDRYQVKFDQVRDQASESELRNIREGLIKRDLHHHVERRLVVNALKASLPKAVVGKLDDIVDKAFKDEIETLKKELKVDTKDQLEAKLIEQGTSLGNLRDSFANQQMALQYMQSKVKSQKTLIGRPEMLKYYNENLAKYKIAAKVRWQEIQINFDGNGGRDGALEILRDKVVADLKAGKSFEDVARKYSNGITAKDGGNWDWTIAGSLTDKQVDNALFQIQVGEISKAIEGKRSFRLIKVIDRTTAGWKPFSDVQNEIQAALEKQDRERRTEKIILELMANAVITTMFDDDPTFQPEWRKNQNRIADRR